MKRARASAASSPPPAPPEAAPAVRPAPPAAAGRDRDRAPRRVLRERLARGIYEREKARDPTRSKRQSSWEELNAGRRATRLNYADELLTTLVGALGVDWSTVESLRACAGAAIEAGGRALEDEAAETRALAEAIEALVPKPADHGRNG